MKIQKYIYIIGDGTTKGKDAKIEDLNVEEKITLLGAKKNPYPYIKNADVFGLFSLLRLQNSD